MSTVNEPVGTFVKVRLAHLRGFGHAHGDLRLRIDEEMYLCADADDAAGRFVVQSETGRILLTNASGRLFGEPAGLYILSRESLPVVPESAPPEVPEPALAAPIAEPEPEPIPAPSTEPETEPEPASEPDAPDEPQKRKPGRPRTRNV